MPFERTIGGKRCRVYHEGYFWGWFADTGDFVAHYVKGGRYKGSYRILKQHLGPFVMDGYGNRILIARAVITCFCPPEPNDGKSYMIGFKDGNPNNCDYRNLQWVEYHYKNTTVPKVRIYADGEFVEVYSSGKIRVKGQDLSVVDYLYDSDMDLHWGLPDPSVRVKKRKIPVDDFMAAAGYVQGDDADLEEPKILHRDMDYKNFASDNLEWVAASDPRYAEYCKKREEDRQARTKELNVGKHVPDYWV